MAPTGYDPLINPRTAPNADREMEDAFDDDDDGFDHSEHTPLTIDHAVHPALRIAVPAPSQPSVYDFEREYDYARPPPGSPPGPSSSARPNDYGNSNGFIPTSPVAAPKPSFFRRAVGVVWPSYYHRVPTGSAGPRGGGIDNDGVFANVMAKPARARTIHGENGEIYMVPEETQAEAPPSYAAASADAAPAYWETTVHAPSATDMNGDMIVDDLPTGSLLTFFFTALVSWFFQLPGFILTYLLHGTHAGKFGSQAGLALTLIQFGFSVTVSDEVGEDGSTGGGGFGLGGSPWSGDFDMGAGMDGVVPTNSTTGELPAPTASPVNGTAALPEWGPPLGMGHEWVSFLLMTIGWFLLLTSLIGYFRVKRFEMSVRASRTRPTPLSAEDVERDLVIRRNLEEVFGITYVFDDGQAHARTVADAPVTPSTATEGALETSRGLRRDDARLEADLRAAGLL
ncbi:hypothetical protein FA95DRAFT_512114 [Auriscalpium vulgare]|uniref:Uncharacterized protein n=1 Tax=Auriscalpium vulgare TaxID=40419 RepID=A0ACB8RG41_9AGAM|nr:hypothetical protein FA95DRAFT_512114 [Auriscalpium vulgare]